MPMSTAHKVCLALALGTSLPCQAQSMEYDLVDDFSFAQNPNGPWSYNEGSNPLPFIDDWNGIGQPAWARAPIGYPGHIPVVFKAVEDEGDWLVGDVLCHSWDPCSGGDNSFANITWTAPNDGFIDITGSTWYATYL